MNENSYALPIEAKSGLRHRNHDARFLPGTVLAQVAPPPPITVVSAGLGCSTTAVTSGFAVLSWKLGAAVPANPSLAGGFEGRAGLTTFSDFTVTKSFDECSPALFTCVAIRKHLPNLTLTQSVGGVPIMTVVLANALVSSYELLGVAATPLPTETVAFRYERITITNLANGSKSCFDSGHKRILASGLRRYGTRCRGNDG